MEKKIIALFLTVISILTLASCGKKNDSYELSDDENSISSKSVSHSTIDIPKVNYEFNYGDKDPSAIYAGTNGFKGDVFVNDTQTIDPQSIYSRIGYTENMFSGDYECDLELFRSMGDFSVTREVKQWVGEPEKVLSTTLPYAWKVGVSELNLGAGTIGSDFQYYDELCEQTELNWVCLRYATREGSINSLCTYEVKGNLINVFEADNLEDKNGKISYTLSSTPITYSFSFKGPYLTLSDGKTSVDLKATCFGDNGRGISAYSLPDSKLIAGVDAFELSESAMTKYAIKRNGTYYSTADIKLCENGIAYIKLVEPDENGNAVVTDKQYVYIISKNDSFFGATLILADENGIYDYSDTCLGRQERLNNGQTFSDEEMKTIEDIYIELASEFSQNGISVRIDRANGEIAIDSAVVFAGDKADISEEGKAFLSKFAKAYFSVVSADKYKGFLVGTKVEGHTAPLANSTYESGLPLSNQRAENVKSYIESAIESAGILQAVGLSNSKPIYDDNGKVDLDACRRVSFRFILSSEADPIDIENITQKVTQPVATAAPKTTAAAVDSGDAGFRASGYSELFSGCGIRVLMPNYMEFNEERSDEKVKRAEVTGKYERIETCYYDYSYDNVADFYASRSQYASICSETVNGVKISYADSTDNSDGVYDTLIYYSNGKESVAIWILSEEGNEYNHQMMRNIIK